MNWLSTFAFAFSLAVAAGTAYAVYFIWPDFVVSLFAINDERKNFWNFIYRVFAVSGISFLIGGFAGLIFNIANARTRIEKLP